MKVSANQPLAGVKVLLVDDSNTIRRSGEMFLAQEGCTVILSDDGFDCLGKAVEHRPDIILLDIMMPRLDGYQACALLKNHPEFADTPVVLITGKDTLADQARGKLAGADQYLKKPFSKVKLMEAVLHHTKRSATTNGDFR
jgi:twitching motility two-component system response regulator PilG